LADGEGQWLCSACTLAGAVEAQESAGAADFGGEMGVVAVEGVEVIAVGEEPGHAVLLD